MEETGFNEDCIGHVAEDRRFGIFSFEAKLM